MPKQKTKVAFVSGKFNVIHPGHVRLFRFAREVSDRLVVGVLSGKASDDVLLSAADRLEGVLANSWVDDAFVIEDSVTSALETLRPDIVVKGKEHEKAFNEEAEIVRGYGGILRFASGEASFSSLSLLNAESENRSANFNVEEANRYLARRGITNETLLRTVEKLTGLRTLVVGDVILDKYVDCQAVGISSEDPTLVVRPLFTQSFIGGAGIVAAHAASLGGTASLVSVVGRDECGENARQFLQKFSVSSCLIEDSSRPTTLKTRYRAENKTLLRVNDVREHEIDSETADAVEQMLHDLTPEVDVLIFADFNYGVVSRRIVETASTLARACGIPIIADSQSSSQIGDVCKFKGVSLVTPTEREARLAVKDKYSGLIKIVEKIREEAQSEQVIVTLGGEGVFLHIFDESSGDWVDDRIPAFNLSPLDLAGAGDAFLVGSGLTLAAGEDLWTAAYVGSIASACQVRTVGNTPLKLEDLITEINR